MKKRITFIISAMLIMLFLSGCTRQEYEVNITEQNSVVFQVHALIDKESYNLLSTFNVDLNELEKNKVSDTGSSIDQVNPLFQEKAMQFKNYGFEITPVDDAVQLGFTAKKSYLTIEEFNEQIKELCGNNMSGLDLDIQYTDTRTNKEYRAYGTLTYIVDEDMGFEDETIKGYFDKQYDTSLLTCKAAIQMPLNTQVTASDGATGSNGAVEWTSSYEEGQKEVHVISEYHDYFMFYVAGFIILILVAVIAFFVLRSLKFKKEKAHSALREEYEYEQSRDNQ